MYSDTQLANRQVDMQKKYILFRNFTDSVWAPCDVHGSKDTLLKLKGMTRHTLGWGGVGWRSGKNTRLSPMQHGFSRLPAWEICELGLRSLSDVGGFLRVLRFPPPTKSANYDNI